MHALLQKLGIQAVNPGGFCGEWLGGGERLESVSPIDGKTIASVTQITLQEYDRSKLSEADALSHDILLWYLQNQMDGLKYTWHGYPVNQMFGVQNGLPRFMANIHYAKGEVIEPPPVEETDGGDTSDGGNTPPPDPKKSGCACSTTGSR